jgi:hypothetical protein
VPGATKERTARAVLVPVVGTGAGVTAVLWFLAFTFDILSFCVGRSSVGAWMAGMGLGITVALYLREGVPGCR